MPPMTDAEERADESWRKFWKVGLNSILKDCCEMQGNYRRAIDRAQRNYDPEALCSDLETPVDDIIRQLKELVK